VASDKMNRRAVRNKRRSNRQNKRQDCLWKLGKSRRARPKHKPKDGIFASLK
jgi:hypothetical protein